MRGPCECECECEREYLISVQIGCASDVSHLSYKLELKTTANFGPPTRPRAASRPSSLSYYRPLSRLDSPHIAPPRTSQRRVELYQRNHVPRQRPQHYRHRYRCRSGILERLVRVTSFSLRVGSVEVATAVQRMARPSRTPPSCSRRCSRQKWHCGRSARFFVASVQSLSPMVVSPGEDAGGGRAAYSPGVIHSSPADPRRVGGLDRRPPEPSLLRQVFSVALASPPESQGELRTWRRAVWATASTQWSRLLCAHGHSSALHGRLGGPRPFGV